MTALAWIFDAWLVALLLTTAFASLHARDLFPGIVLYVAYGLLMALAWIRLEAPDVALAEAAIGAGLTGVLLLGTLARLSGRGGGEADERED